MLLNVSLKLLDRYDKGIGTILPIISFYLSINMYNMLHISYNGDLYKIKEEFNIIYTPKPKQSIIHDIQIFYTRGLNVHMIVTYYLNHN